MSDMQANLAKLRSLSEDDKTENAMLRSRIDQQSELIMILKQRTDEAVTKAHTLERINDELKAFRYVYKKVCEYSYSPAVYMSTLCASRRSQLHLKFCKYPGGAAQPKCGVACSKIIWCGMGGQKWKTCVESCGHKMG